MAPERVQPVKGWIIQNGSDPGQLHPEGPVKQDLLEPVYLRPAVISVSMLRPITTPAAAITASTTRPNTW